LGFTFNTSFSNHSNGTNAMSIDQRPADFLNDKNAANLHVFNTTQLCFEEVDQVNTARVSLVLKEAKAQNAWVRSLADLINRNHQLEDFVF